MPGVNDPTSVPASAGPLTPEHQSQLALANQRARTIRKAARVAAFNGWVAGVFAVLSLPFAPFSITGLLVTVGLSVIACNEFRGRNGLLRFDASSAALLGWNQVGFLTLIVGYCLWMLFSGLAAPCPFAAEIRANPDLAGMVGSAAEVNQLWRFLIILIYGTVIVLSLVFQGTNALYYFTRRKHVEAYLRETPAWVIDLQRTMAG